jgi:hypothetical protein
MTVEYTLLKGERELWRNRQWAVTTRGLTSIPGVNGAYEYFIEKERLTKGANSTEWTWVEHMVLGKIRVIPELFVEAFLVACVEHQVRIRGIGVRITKTLAERKRNDAIVAIEREMFPPKRKFEGHTLGEWMRRYAAAEAEYERRQKEAA